MRARDSDIDARILAAARRQLSVLGYRAMSVAAVAVEAGTTRQALYRRWPTKAQLADAAMASIGEASSGEAASLSGGASVSASLGETVADPFSALVGELEDFERGVSRPGRLSLAGTMLQETTDADAVARYRDRVIAPRRRRIRAILDAAAGSGLIAEDADLEVAVAMATGGWYGRALAGDPVPADWPRRTAVLVWRAVGGVVDGAASGTVDRSVGAVESDAPHSNTVVYCKGTEL